VLRDNLHQPQYVEKLEKIIRFMIKEKSLTLEDLDKIWDAQVRALFRSTLQQSRPNKASLKCPPYVHLSTKSLFDFNEIWHVGRSR